MRADGDRVVFRAGAPDRPGAIVALDLATGAAPRPEEIDRPPRRCRAPPPGLSHAGESLSFPTSGGETAYALFYPPHNADYAAPSGDKPPLLVKCHGGPTAAASSSLNLGTQHWTSRGIAVLDVNYAAAPASAAPIATGSKATGAWWTWTTAIAARKLPDRARIGGRRAHRHLAAAAPAATPRSRRWCSTTSLPAARATTA